MAKKTISKKEIEESLKNIKVTIKKSEKKDAKDEAKKESKEEPKQVTSNTNFVQSLSSASNFAPESLSFNNSRLENTASEFVQQPKSSAEIDSSSPAYATSSKPKYTASSSYEETPRKYNSEDIKPIMNISNQGSQTQRINVFSGAPRPEQIYSEEVSKLEEFARKQVAAKEAPKMPFKRKIKEPELF